MDRIVFLTPREEIGLDPCWAEARSGAAVRRLRRAGGEVEARLAGVREAAERHAYRSLSKEAAALVTAAEAAGMSALAHVAWDVSELSKGMDGNALGAALARPERVAAASLEAAAGVG